MANDGKELLWSAYDKYWRHTRDIAFVKDIRGVYMGYSQPFAKMAGRAGADEIIGKTDFEIFADKELAKRYVDDDARLVEGGRSLENYVEPITSENGRPRYCLTSKYILRDEAGDPAGIFGISRDITVEYEARQSYENELRNLFELPEGALLSVLFDITSWRVVDVRCRDESDQVTSRYGQIDQYFENISASVVDDDEVREFFKKLSPGFLEREYNKGKRGRSLEYLRRMPDGGERWVRDDLYLLLDPVNGNLSLIIVLHDIDKARREYSLLILAAERDSMTGLLNHESTAGRIERYLDGAEGMQALFMIDLDNFKDVNDNFGHQYGDRMLTDVADAVKGIFRDSDIVGRMGGDEFMALMKGAPSEAAVRKKADELVSALQFAASCGERTLEVTASVGVVVFTAGERDFKTLYGEADCALYQSKRRGKNRCSFFDREEQNNINGGEPRPVLENVGTVQLRTLLDYMDGGVVLAEVTDDIRVTYVSPSFYRSFAHTPDEAAGGVQKIFSFVVPEDLPGLRAAVFDAVRSNDLIDHSYRVSYGGTTEWRRIRAKRIPESADGIERIVSVITDITGLKHVNEQLREAEERYRTAAQLSDAMLWEVDIASKTLTLTGSVWKKFNYETLVFPDAPESYLRASTVHPDSVARLRKLYEDLYAGCDSGTYYVKICDENGGEFWVEDKFRFLRDENGTPRRALGITQMVPNINADMRRFEHELRYASIIENSLVGHVRANFTQNLVEYANMNGDNRYDDTRGVTYDEYRADYSAKFVDAADLTQFRRLTGREYLMDRFRGGESWMFVDYRHIGADGSRRWASLFIKLMRHPISGDVVAFGYLRDNETRRRWELAFGTPLQRDTTLLLYSRESMAAFSRYIISVCPDDKVVAVSVVEMLGIERLREESGGFEAREVLFTFGRMCRITIGGDVVIGQLDENRVVMLRTDAGGGEEQRERVRNTMALLKELLAQAHPGTNVNLIGGFSTGRAGGVSYDLLLKKASLACRGASQMYGESAVAYVDAEDEPFGADDEGGLAERYRALELRCQQQMNMLRVSENDELTGLLGKQAFYRRVREILDAGRDMRYEIIRFDVNRFKVYNDVRGTAAGDRLLRDVADRIRRYHRQIILSARLESDHFALFVPDDSGAKRRSVDKLIKWLAGYSPNFYISFSIGVYRVTDPSVDVSLMCDRALLALRSIKSGFDTRLAYYDDVLRASLLDEQQLVSDMEAALESEQFVLYFQPQINYGNGTLTGAEALVRWRHPQRGLLPPADFITLFEQNGLITRLDKYVWERCCKYIRRWIDLFPWARDFSVSVNVSRLDICDPQLCDTLKKIIRKYELPVSALRLEITESAYMESQQQLIDTVEALRKAGFTVEMDDFGSGYSSLNTLKDVAVDILKLDMKFLSNCADSARGGNILCSVIRMAHWLRLPIIAEGVETKAQADYLKSLGCVYMQGYYFAHPMPDDDFEELLARSASSRIDRYQDTNVEGMAAFWDASAQTALLFNSFVGGAAILEYSGGTLEALRVNENFYKALGTTRDACLPVQRDMLRCFDDENRAKLIEELTNAIATGEERGCELRSIPGAGGITRPWTHNRIRLLAKNKDSSILYLSIEDISGRKRMELEQEVENERRRLLMQATGSGLFDYDYASDVLYYQVYLPGAGVERRSVPNCCDGCLESPLLHPASAADLRRVIGQGRLSHLDGEIEFRANLWGKGMRWFRMRYSSVEDANGRVYRIVGQADDIQEFKERAELAESIRHRLNAAPTAYKFNDDVVSQIFDLFYSSSDISGAVETTLALLGEYYDLSRVYIIEDVDGHSASENTFEWCAPGVEPQKEFLKHVSYDEIGGWRQYVSCFDESGVFYCPDMSALPPEIRAILERQGIFAVLQCAIKDDGVYSGMVGFDECRADRRWTEEQVGTLMFVSRIVSSFLLKLRKSDNAAFSADFRAALDDNSAFVYIITSDTFEVIYSNKAIQDFYKNDFVGKNCYREFIGRDEPCEECPVLRLHDPKAPRVVEVQRADGMLVLSYVSPLRWNGRDMVMVSCVDITESKKVELALSSANIALWTYDIKEDCFTISANSAYRYGVKEVLAGAYRAALADGIVMPDSAVEYTALHEKIKNGERTASATIHYNKKLWPAEWMTVTYTAVFDPSGKPSMAIAIGQDVTALIKGGKNH